MGVARETRQDRVIPMLAHLRCMMLENLLRLDGALEYAETGTEFARLQGIDAQIHPALMAQAGIHWLRGEATEAERLHAESVEIALRLEPTTATATTRCNAAARWVDEDPERCIREMVAAGGPLLERADRSWSTWLLSQLVRAAVALGRLEEAERWTAHLERARDGSRARPALAPRTALARSALLVAQDAPPRAPRSRSAPRRRRAPGSSTSTRCRRGWPPAARSRPRATARRPSRRSSASPPTPRRATPASSSRRPGASCAASGAGCRPRPRAARARPTS